MYCKLKLYISCNCNWTFLAPIKSVNPLNGELMDQPFTSTHRYIHYWSIEFKFITIQLTWPCFSEPRLEFHSANSLKEHIHAPHYRLHTVTTECLDMINLNKSCFSNMSPLKAYFNPLKTSWFFNNAHFPYIVGLPLPAKNLLDWFSPDN